MKKILIVLLIIILLLTGCSPKTADSSSSVNSSVSNISNISKNNSSSSATSNIATSSVVLTIPWEKYEVGSSEWFISKYISDFEVVPNRLSEFKNVNEIPQDKIFKFIEIKCYYLYNLEQYYDSTTQQYTIPELIIDGEIEKYFGKFNFDKKKCTFYSVEKSAYISSGFGYGSVLVPKIETINKLPDNIIELKLNFYKFDDDILYNTKTYILQGSDENYIFVSGNTIFDISDEEKIESSITYLETTENEVLQSIDKNKIKLGYVNTLSKTTISFDEIKWITDSDMPNGFKIESTNKIFDYDISDSCKIWILKNHCGPRCRISYNDYVNYTTSNAVNSNNIIWNFVIENNKIIMIVEQYVP